MRTLHLLLAVLVTAPLSAQAQDATDSAAAYETAIDAAVSAFEVGRWSEAREAFTRANAVVRSARAQRGIGMSSFEMNDYVAAAGALEAALAESERALTDRQRAHTMELVAQCYLHFGRFTVGAASTDADLFVDGEPVSPEGWPSSAGSVTLTRGEHEITIRLPGARSASTTVDVAGGENEALSIDRTPLADPPPLERVTALPSAAPEPPAGAEAPDPTGWGVLGGGVGAALVGAVLLGVGGADAHSVVQAEPGTEWSMLRDAHERAPTLMGVGTAILGIGVATAVIGAVLALTNGADDRERVRLRGNGLEVSF